MKEDVLSYLGRDGLLHIVCCALLVGIIGLIAPLWVAIVATVVVGVAKELVWDKWLGKGTFDWKDLLCDLVGILIGTL